MLEKQRSLLWFRKHIVWVGKQMKCLWWGNKRPHWGGLKGREWGCFGCVSIFFSLSAEVFFANIAKANTSIFHLRGTNMNLSHASCFRQFCVFHLDLPHCFCMCRETAVMDTFSLYPWLSLASSTDYWLMSPVPSSHRDLKAPHQRVLFSLRNGGSKRELKEVCLLVGWLVRWLVKLMGDWLVHWLNDLLVGWLVGWLVDSLVSMISQKPMYRFEQNMDGRWVLAQN